MRLPRASGILLHLTSLPGRYGIGDLGPEAIAFLDILAETGQRWWQMLPVGPIGAGNSPYSSTSSFAGSSVLISPDRLVEDGLLANADLNDYPELPADHVDYPSVIEAKSRLLQRAFKRFRPDSEFEAFRARSQDWLDEYTLYAALKSAFDHKDWNQWDRDIAKREPAALAHWKSKLAEDIHYHEFVQYVFEQQWQAFRRDGQKRNIGLIGDLPIFISLDSAEVWASPELFQLDEDGRPTHVSGVPPDYFNKDGQRWGNPLYRWEAHARDNFAWWVRRLKGTSDRFDLVRLDHFRGFEAGFSIPADAETAADPRCRWDLAPGAEVLEAMRDSMGGQIPLIAEDLGMITFEVEALRDRYDLPGMRVLQFGFGDDPKAGDYLPYGFVNHCVAYTGTHDNDTTVGWFTAPAGATTQSAEALKAERAFVRRYLGTDCSEIHWDFIRLASGSVADTAIIPLQDVLGLGSEARMNVPGVGEGNWEWRIGADHITPEALARLADITAVYDRWNGEVPQSLRSPRKPKPKGG